MSFGSEIWFHHKMPAGDPDDVDVSPALHASALAAMVRCANATGEPQYFQEAESWFEGLQKAYPKSVWNTSVVSFHKSSIIWESLALVGSYVSRESSFYENIVDYTNTFEHFLRKEWKNNAEFWSFASARALAIRWRSGSLR